MEVLLHFPRGRPGLLKIAFESPARKGGVLYSLTARVIRARGVIRAPLPFRLRVPPGELTPTAERRSLSLNLKPAAARAPTDLAEMALAPSSGPIRMRDPSPIA